MALIIYNMYTDKKYFARVERPWSIDGLPTKKINSVTLSFWLSIHSLDSWSFILGIEKWMKNESYGKRKSMREYHYHPSIILKLPTKWKIKQIE